MHKFRTQILIWGPVLAVMLILFVSSAQPKYENPEKGDTVYFSGAVPIFPGGWDVLIKKSSHVIVYGALGGLLLRGLRLSGYPLRQAAYLAVVIAVCYAITDEYHQSFVVGRSASMMDIGFDLVGAALACWLIYGYLKRALPRPEGRVEPSVE
jgi:VanZ family protein